MNTYDAVSAKARDAEATFTKVTTAYRTRLIGDAEYIAARKVRDARSKEYDAAYAAEMGWVS